jgi:hypothetical protein
MPDFLTIDVFHHAIRETPARRLAIRAALAGRPAGLRTQLVNYANTGSFTLVPRPVGTCLLLAWDSPEAARAAWRGPLGAALGGGGDFRMDAEVARARTEHGDDHWHGWRPSDDGATPIAKSEPMVVLVHGIVRRRHLTTFLRDNLHAASRARHHPGHRGSIDVHTRPPLENTSISIWDTRASAQDFAYQPGGHAPAMKRARELDTHTTGVYVQARPLASTGSLGIAEPALPNLPEAVR